MSKALPKAAPQCLGDLLSVDVVLHEKPTESRVWLRNVRLKNRLKN